MNLSFNTFVCPNWSLKQLLAAGEQHGYRGFEIRCDAQQAHGIEVHIDRMERKKVRREIERSGLQPILLATSLRLLDEHLLEDAPLRIGLASDIGAKGVRVFCGPVEWREQYEASLFTDKVVSALRALADLAEQQDVEIWLETHDSLTSGPEVVRMLELVQNPKLGVVYDIILPWRNGEPVKQTVQALGQRIRHVHFHDGMKRQDKLELTPFGQGEVPIAEVLKELALANYDGYLSAEWFEPIYGDDPGEAMERYRMEVTRVTTEQGLPP